MKHVIPLPLVFQMWHGTGDEFSLVIDNAGQQSSMLSWLVQAVEPDSPNCLLNSIDKVIKPLFDRTGSGSQYSPSAPSVAYALAMSSGVVADTPRVNAPHWCALAASLASLDARNWMPSCRAALTAFSAPISHSSGTQ